jgi:hypothetical protein
MGRYNQKKSHQNPRATIQYTPRAAAAAEHAKMKLAKWMVLDSAGTQPHVSAGRLTPEALLQKLNHGPAKNWQAGFKAVIREDCGGLCVLECLKCGEPNSASNPSKVNSDHTCKQHLIRRSPRYSAHAA